MAKNKFSKNWLHQHINDPYVKLAQQKGYRARAAFKLTEILDTEKLLKPGDVVIDLGSAPGSWSQVARQRLAGPQGTIRGRIIALDLLPMEPVAGVEFIQGDFREEEVLQQLETLLGNQHVCDLAREFAQAHLKPEGALIVKAFHGSGFSQIVQSFKQTFRRVVERKPKASRDKSSETFLVGVGLKYPGGGQ